MHMQKKNMEMLTIAVTVHRRKSTLLALPVQFFKDSRIVCLSEFRGICCSGIDKNTAVLNHLKACIALR